MNWSRIRWVLAACTLLISVRMFSSAFEIESAHSEGPSLGLPAALPIIFGVLAFVATIILIAPDTVKRLAEWCARPFAAIFYPADEFSKPPLDYKLARRYRDEQRWEDAARQYRKLIRYYPKEREAYLELLEVAHRMGDDELRKEYTARFRKRFKVVPPQAPPPAAPGKV